MSMSAMRTIEFLDDVIIRRSNGEYDEYDNPTTEIIYEGKCNYQEGRVNTFSVITRRPTVFIPSLEIIEVNDQVEVTTHLGYHIKGLVDIPMPIEMPLHKDVKLTKLELKQAQ